MSGIANTATDGEALIYLKAATHHSAIRGMPQVKGNARSKSQGKEENHFPE